MAVPSHKSGQVYIVIDIADHALHILRTKFFQVRKGITRYLCAEKLVLLIFNGSAHVFVRQVGFKEAPDFVVIAGRHAAGKQIRR